MTQPANIQMVPSPQMWIPPTVPPPPRRISKITISDFRGFPAGAPYRFQLDDGKNLLLHGENGSGKSSLYHALRLLLSTQKPEKHFTDYKHIFASPDASTAGVVAIDLTSGIPPDYRWDAGNPHPSEDNKDASFREIARRATFLDYKASLQTGFLHETKSHVNIFDLLVKKLLYNVELPSGRTIGQSWHDVKQYYGNVRRRRRNRDGRRKHINELAKTFSDQLNGILNAENVGIVAKTNELLKNFSNTFGSYPGGQLPTADGFKISLKVSVPELSTEDMRKTLPPHAFIGEEVILRAHFGGKQIEHPAVFFNEARLTAIALALYLGAALTGIPKPTASNSCPLLVLDDALIGLDLAHRIPLLDILNSEDFKNWQIFLLTYDANWYDMASDHLPSNLWVKQRLHVKAHEGGWEMPILETDSPYLDRAWNYIQGGDFKAAGVYLRTAWETVMRIFCEAHFLKVPLKRSTYEYKAEEFWNLVKTYEFKPGQRLVDEALAGEIKICQSYVLNPLCHNDPARPTREEVRRAHGAITRLKDLIEQDVAWKRQSKNKGKTPSNEYSLTLAGDLLGINSPPISVIASLLRNAFDKALWAFCGKKAISFTVTCDVPLNTGRLWQEATTGAGGLAASQPSFVSTVNANADLMLAESPDNGVFASKSLADLQNLFAEFHAGTPANAPKMVMDSW